MEACDLKMKSPLDGFGEKLAEDQKALRHITHYGEFRDVRLVLACSPVPVARSVCSRFMVG